MKFDKKFFIITSLITTLGGILCFALIEEWIIIKHPWWQTYEQRNPNAFSKHIAAIFIWSNNQWINEKNNMIWSETDIIDNIKLLTQATLTFLFEEELTKKKVYVEAVMNTADNTETLIMFDRNPFSKTMSTRQKLLIIESILKTIRENGIKAPKIRFLVNNQTLADPHLDFSISWPLEGFFE
jgi:hypothetical protein